MLSVTEARVELRRQEMPAGTLQLVHFILSFQVLGLQLFLTFQGTLGASVNHSFCFSSVSLSLVFLSVKAAYLPPPAHTLIPVRLLPWHLSPLT